MKGRVIAIHLAHCSLEKVEEIQGDFPDEDIIRCTLTEPQIKMEVELKFS